MKYYSIVATAFIILLLACFQNPAPAPKSPVVINTKLVPEKAYAIKDPVNTRRARMIIN